MKLLGFLLVLQVTTPILQASPQRTKVDEGSKATIACSLVADEGVHWFRQGKKPDPEFLVYISGIGAQNPAAKDKYSVAKSSQKVSLTVKDFRKEDSGKYYCLMAKNRALKFGKTQEYYVEEVATTPKLTTTSTTTKKTVNTPENIERTPTKPVIHQDGLSCHMIIWAPLAGGTLLLLLALILVSIVYCRTPRRRRCQHQFRKRPIADEVRRPSNGYY
ncbi:T-cell surface glycoprotein CD8 alpha chain [Scyliorhinus torazame]